jgi:hypothetical protein
LEESATIELSHLEQLHLRQAIFTFFLRLGISIEELTPETIRTTKSLQVDEGGMASIAVAIPVSQTSSNRHVWWCTRLSANDDTPMREDSPPPDQPATKLIMSPVTICHLPASNEDRAITVSSSLSSSPGRSVLTQHSPPGCGSIGTARSAIWCEPCARLAPTWKAAEMLLLVSLC